MAGKSRIEWTEKTWNPTTGCTKVGGDGDGCANCYAERDALRFSKDPASPYHGVGFNLTLHPKRLAGKNTPETWQKPCTVFVNSMSDLFHKGIPTDYLDRVFDVMDRVDRHTYQILTKRSSRMRDYIARRYARLGGAPDHIWLGVSVEHAKVAVRLDHLRQTPSRRRFVSLEPLLGSVADLSLEGIGWAIVGGESGPKARPMKEEWALEALEMCRRDGTAFFFKQWGGVRKGKAGRKLGGRLYEEIPEDWRRGTPDLLHRDVHSAEGEGAAAAPEPCEERGRGGD